jgi:hypothetical protein
MGSPGLIMSGSKDEGPLLGGVRPDRLPCGRGVLVGRRTGARLVQTALAGEIALAGEASRAEEAELAGLGQVTLPGQGESVRGISAAADKLLQIRR